MDFGETEGASRIRVLGGFLYHIILVLKSKQDLSGAPVPRKSVTNYHKLAENHSRVIVSQLQKLEVSSQGVSRATLPLKPLGQNPSLPLQLPVAPDVPWLAAV